MAFDKKNEGHFGHEGEKEPVLKHPPLPLHVHGHMYILCFCFLCLAVLRLVLVIDPVSVSP